MPDAILTIPALIKFLAKRSPRRQYEYAANCDCLIARMIRAQTGARAIDVNVCSYQAIIRGRTYRIPERLNAAALIRPWNYRDALKRARKLQRS